MDDLTDHLKARISTLEERIRQLEDILVPITIAIPVEWRLTPAEARVFAHLTTREMGTKTSIMAALYSDKPDDYVDPKIVDVFVCKMRKKLRAFKVDIATVWGQGYALADRQRYAVKGPNA